jgi:hypothetical protein
MAHAQPGALRRWRKPRAIGTAVPKRTASRSRDAIEISRPAGDRRGATNQSPPSQRAVKTPGIPVTSDRLQNASSTERYSRAPARRPKRCRVPPHTAVRPNPYDSRMAQTPLDGAGMESRYERDRRPSAVARSVFNAAGELHDRAERVLFRSRRSRGACVRRDRSREARSHFGAVRAYGVAMHALDHFARGRLDRTRETILAALEMPDVRVRTAALALIARSSQAHSTTTPSAGRTRRRVASVRANARNADDAAILAGSAVSLARESTPRCTRRLARRNRLHPARDDLARNASLACGGRARRERFVDARPLPRPRRVRRIRSRHERERAGARHNRRGDAGAAELASQAAVAYRRL